MMASIAKGTGIGYRIWRARKYLTGSGLGPLLVRAVAGSTFVRLASMLTSLLVGVQLARQLGVEGYGYYGFAFAIIAIVSIPCELGLPTLVTREVASASVSGNSGALFGVLRWADRTCWMVSGVMVVGMVIAASVLWGDEHLLASTLLAGAGMIPFMALSRIRGGSLQGLQNIVLGQVPANLLKPVFLSALLALTYVTGVAIGPASAMLLNSITAIMVFAIARHWLQRRLPRNREAEPIVNGRRWLASTIPLAMTDGIRTLQTELTILLVGLLASTSEAGLLRIAVVTATVAAAPMPVMVRVAMPVIARLHAEADRFRLQKFVTYSAYVQTAGVILLSLPLLFFPEILLVEAFGPPFAPAANALRIISLGQIANAAFGSNIVLLNMTNHERRVTRAMGIGLAMNVVTVLLLVHTKGIVGGAIGFVVSLLSWNILTWIDGRRILGVETSVFPFRGSIRAL